MGVALPPLHPIVVAIEKRAFGSPSTTVANFTYTKRLLLYMKIKDIFEIDCILRWNLSRKKNKKTKQHRFYHFDLPQSGVTTTGQSESESNGNEEVLHIPQNFSNSAVSLSDCLVFYSGHSLGESNSCAEMQSMYSTAPANWDC